MLSCGGEERWSCEDEKQLQMQKLASLFMEMKQLMLKKSGMPLEEERWFPNRLRMGDTSKTMSTICVLQKSAQLFAFGYSFFFLKACGIFM
jgi:hypothetical protein